MVANALPVLNQLVSWLMVQESRWTWPKRKAGLKLQVEHDAPDDVALPRSIGLWQLHIPDLILGIQSVEENEVIEAEVSVEPEPADSKLDKVASLLAPKTDLCQSLNPSLFPMSLNPTIF